MAKRNDGTLDSIFIQPYALQPHKYYNLYSDTTAYFLTYNSFFSRGLRNGLCAVCKRETICLLKIFNTHTSTSCFTISIVPGSFSERLSVYLLWFKEKAGREPPSLKGRLLITPSTLSSIQVTTGPEIQNFELLLVGRDAVSHSISGVRWTQHGPLDYNLTELQ